MGASYGYWSLLLSNHGFIPIAIDGSSEVSKVGKINFILNGIPPENYLEKWIIPVKGHTYYKHESSFSFTNHINLLGTDAIRNTCTLNELLDMYKPSLIKLDLEGLDFSILINTEVRLLQNIKYIVIEVQNFSDESLLIKEFLVKQGFALLKTIGLDGTILTNDESVIANLHFGKRNLANGLA